jgi:hypothetical protein
VRDALAGCHRTGRELADVLAPRGSDQRAVGARIEPVAEAPRIFTSPRVPKKTTESGHATWIQPLGARLFCSSDVKVLSRSSPTPISLGCWGTVSSAGGETPVPSRQAAGLGRGR